MTSGIVSASTLPQPIRREAALLAITSLAELYDNIGLDRETLTAAISDEFGREGCELQNAQVLLGSESSVRGLIAFYPAEEIHKRQVASTFHLLSYVDASEIEQLMKSMALHTKMVAPVPLPALYLARLAISDGERRSGYGSKLFGVFRRAADGGALCLHVHTENRTALAFYRFQGLQTLSDGTHTHVCMTGRG